MAPILFALVGYAILLHMIHAILFDLDGTIIDSELIAFKSIMDCYDQWGIKISKADASSVVGKKWEVAFSFLFKKYVLPVSEEQASKIILQRYKERIQKEVAIVPGVVEAIEFFAKEKGLKLALVSGSRRDDILWALTKLNVKHHFEVILGAEDYPNSKPAPDGYEMAMKALGVKPEACLVLEDSTAGIASGHAAGAKVLAITAANHFGMDTSAAHISMKDFSGVDHDWFEKIQKDLFKKS